MFDSTSVFKLLLLLSVISATILYKLSGNIPPAVMAPESHSAGNQRAIENLVSRLRRRSVNPSPH
jgi:hypothetical protein